MPWIPQVDTALGLARWDPTAHPPILSFDDPRHGRVTDPEEMRTHAAESAMWLREHDATVRTIGSTQVPGRAVIETVVHFTQDDRLVGLPVGVVAQVRPGDTGADVRMYNSQWPVTGRHLVRPAILPSWTERPGDVVARYWDGLCSGDVEAVMATLEPDAYVREPSGEPYVHHGARELRELYGRFFAGGGIGLEICTVTDDGMLCAVEYTCTGWGGRALAPPQAALAVHERGAQGLLAAVRLYDDIAPPPKR